MNTIVYHYDAHVLIFFALFVVHLPITFPQVAMSSCFCLRFNYCNFISFSTDDQRRWSNILPLSLCCFIPYCLTHLLFHNGLFVYSLNSVVFQHFVAWIQYYIPHRFYHGSPMATNFASSSIICATMLLWLCEYP